MFIRRRKNRGKLSKIKSFRIYYGIACTEAEQVLGSVDLAILEPRQWAPKTLSALRDNEGTTVCGYLSVMESPDWNTHRSEQLKFSDLLLDKGHPIRFPQWNSVLMDLRSIHYRRLLLDEIAALVNSYPLDGFLLDTVGDIEDYVPASLRSEMSDAYQTFLIMAAGQFPDLCWMQNRGFEQLHTCANLLDGFLWEGWNGQQISTDWTQHWLDVLEGYQQTSLSILSVTSDDSSIHRKTAEQLGFVHWTSMGSSYNAVH